MRSVYFSLEESIDRSTLSIRASSLRDKYIDNISEWIKYIHLPYMADHKLLSELFVELYAFKTPLKYRLRKNTRKSHENKMASIKEILNSHHHIAMLGEPESGKTTF